MRSHLAGADREGRTTTGAGSTTTVVSSAVIGRQVDFYRGKYLLMTSGTASGEWRTITDFTSSSGTFTIAPALSAGSGSGSTFEIYTLAPHLATIAVNRAIPKAHPAICKPEVDYAICLNARTRAMGIPRGIEDLWAVYVEDYSSQKLKDRFDRADSATSIGGEWTVTAGTWGLTGERGYSVSDADADFITYDAELEDGMVSCIIRGTLNHATVYRVPILAFRIREDYLGAIDTTNCLLVEVRNALVDLRKVDDGTESSLTTAAATTSDGVDYVPRVRFEGPIVTVWLDDVEVIRYELTGLNLKYLDFPRVGVRWDKGGSPATAARIDDFRAHRIVPFSRHHNWQLSPDKQVAEFGSQDGPNLSTDHWVRFEGSAPLTLLDADTTDGTLATDSTARLELEAEGPHWDLFLEYCFAEYYKLGTDPAWNLRPETWSVYEAKAANAAENAERMRGKSRYRMPRPAPVSGRPN